MSERNAIATPQTSSGRILASLAFVLAGLGGRALIDKLLSASGGAVAVAGWAQLASVAEVVTGVSLAGMGTALTVLAADSRHGQRYVWLKPALVVSLSLSLVVALIGLALLHSPGFAVLPGETWLPLVALLAGWLSVAPGLLAAWLLGAGRPGHAAILVAASFVPPGTFLLLAVTDSALLNLLLGQMFSGLTATVVLLLVGRGQGALSGTAIKTLVRFLPAGLAIGVLGPVTTAWARLEIADSLSWQAVGQVQALWRTSDWVTAIMAGMLNAYFLPRLSAATGRVAFLAELRRAALATVLPAVGLLLLLGAFLPQALALLYRADVAVSRADAVFFLLGDWLRVISWVTLFGLFARRAARAITVGEFLSLPLFALLLTVLPGVSGVHEIGILWCLTYLAYATFNSLALWRSLPDT